MLFNGSPRLKKGLSWLAVWLLLVSGVAALNVTIKGKMGQSSFDEPVRYAYVELWEAKVSGDVFHQSSFTSNMGEYEFSSVNLNESTSFYIRVHTLAKDGDNDILHLEDKEGSPHWTDTATVDCGSNATCYINDTIGGSSVQFERVYQVAVNAYDFLKGYTDNTKDLDGDGQSGDVWNQPIVTLNYPVSFTVAGSSVNIFLATNDTVQHEYSHGVMYKLYGTVWDQYFMALCNPFSVHSWDTISNPYCAFSEGFAGFMPKLIHRSALLRSDQEIENQTTL